MNYTEIEMEGMKEILRDKEEEIKKLKEIRDNREEKIADLEIEICKLKEEKDNFMLKYSKALEEKIVETNKLCTERNKLVEENKKLKSDLSLVIKERDDNIKVNEFFKKTNSELGNVIEGLKEQNKKLSEENGQLKADNEYRKKIVDIIPQDEKSVAEETIQDLQERIRFLEQCLDNKEKVNKSLREELEKLKNQN